jgi:hypothetical protein
MDSNLGITIIDNDEDKHGRKVSNIHNRTVFKILTNIDTLGLKSDASALDAASRRSPLAATYSFRPISYSHLPPWAI